MRNSRICPENNARFSNLMCENAHHASLTLSLPPIQGYHRLGKIFVHDHFFVFHDHFSSRFCIHDVLRKMSENTYFLDRCFISNLSGDKNYKFRTILGLNW